MVETPNCCSSWSWLRSIFAEALDAAVDSHTFRAARLHAGQLLAGATMVNIQEMLLKVSMWQCVPRNWWECPSLISSFDILCLFGWNFAGLDIPKCPWVLRGAASCPRAEWRRAPRSRWMAKPGCKTMDSRWFLMIIGYHLVYWCLLAGVSNVF